MKYLIRVVKYYIYLLIILVIIMGAMVLLKLVPADISMMFRDGMRSLWQIALMLLVFSLLYPRFGYCKRKVQLSGEFSQTRKDIISVMKDNGYILASEEGERLKFRLPSVMARLKRMMEDTVTLTYTFGGYEIEGLSRDVLRLHRALDRIQDQNA